MTEKRELLEVDFSLAEIPVDYGYPEHIRKALAEAEAVEDDTDEWLTEEEFKKEFWAMFNAL